MELDGGGVRIGDVLADSHSSGLLATQSVAISPVSPVYSYDHHQHQQQQQQQHQLGGTAAPRRVDFARTSPVSLLPVVVETASVGGGGGGSPIHDVRLASYAQPTALDPFYSPAASTMPPAICTPLQVGIDDRPSSALQLMDYVTPAARVDCIAVPYGGHLSTRGDAYRSIGAAPGDPFVAGDMYHAFPVTPQLKSEIV